MRVATVRSRCECQASLVAVLNENRHVMSGYVVDRDGAREDSPAHTMGAQNPRFDVGWLCAVCGRNVLRSFSVDALGWREAPEAPAGAAASAAAATAPGAAPVGAAAPAAAGVAAGSKEAASLVKLGTLAAPASASGGAPALSRGAPLLGGEVSVCPQTVTAGVGGA